MGRSSRRMSIAPNESFQQNALTWSKIEEKLRSGVPDGQQSIQVYARTRPPNSKELESNSAMVVDMDESTATISVHNGKGGPSTDFTLDKCFPGDCSQSRLYEEVGVDIVSSSVQGYTTCVFAYGQTASGKSHSMVGTKTDPGLIPRVCNGLYHSFDCLVADTTVGRNVSSVVIEAVYYEIYNEKIMDLLDPSLGPLKVREHKTFGVFVDKISKVYVKSVEQAVEVMDRGLLNRTVQATKMNSVSSRAHAIFELHITQKYESGGAEMALKSKVCMVDLAGSERAGQQELKGARMTEGNNINKSLSQLMLCIQFLVKQSKADVKASEEGKKAPRMAIPFRDSKLTWLLKESLSGNARTHMLTAVSPAAVNYEDTVSTLRYASSAKNIKTMSHIEESPLERRVRELNEEVERLRADLVKFQSGEASQSGGGARLQDKMATNLSSLQAQLDSEKQLNTELGTHWSKSRAAAEDEDDGNDLDLLNSELGVVPPSPGTSARQRKAFALNQSTQKAKEDPDAKNAVYYLSNLNEDEALSGRWKVPLIRKLCIGRRATQSLSDEDKKDGVRYLEVGTGGTDLELKHCSLNVSPDGNNVTLDVSTKGAVCFVNGARVGPIPQRLYHGDRIALGESASYMAVFVDLKTAACTVSAKSETRASRRFSTLYTPDVEALSKMLPSSSAEGYDEAQEVLADIDEVVNAMEVKFVDALREMMFGTKGSRFAPRGSVAVGSSLLRPSSAQNMLRRSQSAIHNSIRSPKALTALGEADDFGAEAVTALGMDDEEDEMDAGKFTLLGDLASARQVFSEANKLAKALAVDIRFSLELKTNELDIPEGPTAMADLDSCITYDKFTVIVKCSAELPIYSTTKGLDKMNRKSKWAAIGAAEIARVKGNTKSHFLFECDVDDLRDVVGALREARKRTSDGMVSLEVDAPTQMKLSDLEKCFSCDATPEQESLLFNSLCQVKGSTQPPIPPDSAGNHYMGHEALSKVMSALGISMNSHFDVRSSLSGEAHEELVKDLLTKYDTTGHGQALDEEGFRNMLSFHARQMVGSSLESLVNNAQRAVFEAFLEGVPLGHMAHTGEETPRLRSDTTGMAGSDGFLHSSASSSSLLSNTRGGGGGGRSPAEVTLRLETENARLQEVLVNVLSAFEGSLNSQGLDAAKKIQELVGNGAIPAAGCSDLIHALKAGMK